MTTTPYRPVQDPNNTPEQPPTNPGQDPGVDPPQEDSGQTRRPSQVSRNASVLGLEGFIVALNRFRRDASARLSSSAISSPCPIREVA
jgi:hypothetical protein